MSRAIVQAVTFKKGSETGFNANKFSKFLEEQYLKSNKSGFKQKVSFSPSSIGGYNGICPRYWYIAFTGAEFVDSNDALGIANMANGTAAHSRIERLLQDSGIPVDVEVEIKHEDPPIRGFVDMMLEWEGEIVVGEFKTMRQEGFLIRQSTLKPTAQHLIQLLIYLKVTGKTSGFLLYENKNDNSFLVIPVSISEKHIKIVNDVFEWMRMVHNNYTSEEGGLPKRPVSKKNKICKSCPVYDECWNKLEEGTVELPLMEVPKI